MTYAKIIKLKRALEKVVEVNSDLSFNDISDTETYSNCIFYLDWAIDYIESVISVLEEEVSLEEYYEE